MAAIGIAWADGAWDEASWAVGAWRQAAGDFDEAVTLAATAAVASAGGADFDETAAAAAVAALSTDSYISLDEVAALVATGDLTAAANHILAAVLALEGAAAVAVSPAGSVYVTSTSLAAAAAAATFGGLDSDPADTVTLAALATIFASATLIEAPAEPWTVAPPLTDRWIVRPPPE